MPYLLLYEDTFVLIISVIIAGVLGYRWYVVQRRKK